MDENEKGEEIIDGWVPFDDDEDEDDDEDDDDDEADDDDEWLLDGASDGD